MKSALALFAVLFWSPLAELHTAEPPKSDTKPNVIIILADDLGWGDVSCYGATRIKTPHIDQLAREGMRFTDAHTAASVCSPSRYGLITGRYPWRLHLKGNDYRLEPGRTTLAFSAPRDDTARASCGNGAKRKLLSFQCQFLQKISIARLELFRRFVELT